MVLVIPHRRDCVRITIVKWDCNSADRVAAFEAVGREFESHQSLHFKILLSINSFMRYNNLLRESQRILERENLDESFMRLPGHVIGNELYVAQKRLKEIYESLKAGNDFNDKDFSNLITKLISIRKEAKRFRFKEEVPVAYSYKHEK